MLHLYKYNRKPRTSLNLARSLWWCFTVLVVVASVTSTVSAQDKQDMPWYDSEANEVRPIGIKLRDDESNPERHDVAPYRPKKKNATNNTGNTGGAFGGGTARGGAALGSILSVLMWTLAAVIAVALLVAMAYLLYKVPKREPEEELVPRRTVEESIQQLPFELDVAQKGDFKSMAYQLYQQGDLRRAMILLFSHVLVSLDQRGFVRLKKGKTNRQYLRELGPYQSLGNYYGQVMVRFEEAFFGDHEIDRPAFESCWNGLDSFQSGLETTAINTEVMV